MTYQAFEQGQSIGAPKELYRFVRGAQCWLYTSADEDTLYQGETYVARTISRGAFDRNDETASSEISIRIDRALGVAEQFLDGSSAVPVVVTIYRLHRTDAEAIIMFRGTVANAAIEIEEVVLSANSPLGKNEVQVPRELMMRTCPHELYGNQCRVLESAFQLDTTIAGVAVGGFPNKYTIPTGHGHPVGYFTAGMLTRDSTGQKAFIQLHAPGGVLWFINPMVGLEVSDAVTILAGCDRKVETCRDKFNNVPQFGGYPRLPERNPFVSINADDIWEPGEGT